MRIRAVFPCFLIVTGCLAEAPAPATSPAPVAAVPSVSTFGRVTTGPTVSPTAVLADLDAFHGKPIRLEGTATRVCERAGCWMDVADSTHTIRIKVRDGEVTFPMSARGRRVIAEGTLVKLPADPAKDPASCGAEAGHDCARPSGATARLDGVGATVFESG